MFAFQIVGALLVLLALASMMSLDNQESQRIRAGRPHAPARRGFSFWRKPKAHA